MYLSFFMLPLIFKFSLIVLHFPSYIINLRHALLMKHLFTIFAGIFLLSWRIFVAMLEHFSHEAHMMINVA